MSVTLVVQRRALPGQADALTAAALRLLSARDAWSPARLRVRLFRGRHRPGLLLILADWASRQTAVRYAEARGWRADLDRVSTAPAAARFFHELSTYETFTAPVATAACSRIRCRPAAVPSVLSFILEIATPTVRAQPGLLLQTLYQDEDRPNSFLTLRGWESEAARDASYGTLAASLDAQFRERGASITHFVGQPLVDLSPPRP